MTKLFATAALALAIATPALAGDDVTLTMGRFGPSSANVYTEQTITITNNTDQKMHYVEVECGFFSQGTLMDTGTALGQNIPAGGQAYVTVNASSKFHADSVKCRVKEIDR